MGRSDLLKLLCTVEATIPKVPDSGTSSVGANGKQHQQFYYHVLLFFGGPEIRAQIAWTENVSLPYSLSLFLLIKRFSLFSGRREKVCLFITL